MAGGGGDRFISARAVQGESFSTFDTKSAIFQGENGESYLERLGYYSENSDQENNSGSLNGSTYGGGSARQQFGDENQRMYATLLQN